MSLHFKETPDVLQRNKKAAAKVDRLLAKTADRPATTRAAKTKTSRPVKKATRRGRRK